MATVHSTSLLTLNSEMRSCKVFASFHFPYDRHVQEEYRDKLLAFESSSHFGYWILHDGSSPSTNALMFVYPANRAKDAYTVLPPPRVSLYEYLRAPKITGYLHILPSPSPSPYPLASSYYAQSAAAEPHPTFRFFTAPCISSYMI